MRDKNIIEDSTVTAILVDGGFYTNLARKPSCL